MAGQKFNVQINGQSAVWTYSENATPSTVVVLEDRRLGSNPAADGKSVTAYVPDELCAKSGEYPLYLLGTKTGQKSSEIKFIVR